MNRMFKGHFTDQAFFLVNSRLVFLRWVNIRVIEQDRDLKILGQIFQHITAAWSAAAVQQQTWHPVLFYQSIDHLI